MLPLCLVNHFRKKYADMAKNKDPNITVLAMTAFILFRKPARQGVEAGQENLEHGNKKYWLDLVSFLSKH